MTLAYEGEEIPWVSAAVRTEGGELPQEVSLRIDERDSQLQALVEEHPSDREGALAGYFLSGLELANAIRRLAEGLLGSSTPDRRLLEVGCGFGRLTRFLVSHSGAATISVTDPDEKAVAFVSSELGVKQVEWATVKQGTLAQASSPYDLIVVHSLSSLASAAFEKKLEELAGTLTVGGALLWLRDATGTSIVAELASSWQRRRLEGAVPGFGAVEVLARAGDPELKTLSFDAGPEAEVERCEIPRQGLLRLSGWAISMAPRSPVRSVEVWLDQERIASTAQFGARPDLSDRLEELGLSKRRAEKAGLDPERRSRCGWSCECALPLSLSPANSLLEVRAISAGGVGRTAFLGSLEYALYRVTKKAFERYADRAMEVEGIIEAMKTSWFWRQRTRWFRFKRRLGLTDEE